MRAHSGFCSSVNFRTRVPSWVAEHLSASSADDPAADRKHSRFRPDPSVPERFRATNEDYRGSNLSRGHLAPAGAHKESQASLDETFLLSSNIVPQELSNNGSDWLRLERWTKGLLRSHSDVYVISGPLWLPDAPAGGADGEAPTARSRPERKRVSYDVIGPHEVAVPTHLFKVVAACTTPGAPPSVSAFVLPNGPLRGHPDLDEFVVPLAEVERAAGLTFFPTLSAAPAPLCGDGKRCGVGAMDGRIKGWKMLGNLKLAADCEELASAWQDVQDASAKLDAMPLMARTRDERGAAMACKWAPPRPA